MSQPPVTILMAVRNGAAHLPAQLASLTAQTGVEWRLVVGDDGSEDASPTILQEFARTHPVALHPGPRQGFVANFMALLARHDGAGAVALADQDDVWLPGKLARASAALATLPPGRPALYCSRRLDWWPATGRQRPSRALRRPPDFANALVENIAFGNTVVLNAAAARLARATAGAARDVPFHDWWLYLLVSGVGGQVIHDPEPGLLYRQHGGNLVGAGAGSGAGYAPRIARNLAALQRIAPRLTPESRARLAEFSAARATGLPGRLVHLWRSGVQRQQRRDRIRFWGAACLGRI